MTDQTDFFYCVSFEVDEIKNAILATRNDSLAAFAKLLVEAHAKRDAASLELAATEIAKASGVLSPIVSDMATHLAAIAAVHNHRAAKAAETRKAG